MKRPFILLILFLFVDQALKSYFQQAINYPKTNEIFGFTYAVNHGLWIDANIKNEIIYLLFSFSFIVWLLVIYLLNKYQKLYRKSIIVDLAFAFYSVGILGNMIDKIFLGYIRDYFITPISICNFADISGLLGVFTFLLEFVFFPKARNIIKYPML